MDLCKKFLQFMHSASSMRTFTRETGVLKPFDYKLTNDDYNQLTPFAKSSYDIMTDENVDIVTPLTTSQFRFYLGAKVDDREWQTSLTNYGEFYEPLEAFYNNSAISAKSYFDGAVKYYQNLWPAQYSNYLLSIN